MTLAEAVAIVRDQTIPALKGSGGDGHVRALQRLLDEIHDLRGGLRDTLTVLAASAERRNRGLSAKMRKHYGIAIALLLALLPALASAQEPIPSPCNPALAACLSTETWALGLRAWSPDGDPRDIAGARGQAELRRGPWRVRGRFDGTASAGEYRAGELATVKDVEAHLAVAYDWLHLPQGVTLGPLAAIGGAVSLDHQDGIRVSIPRAGTAVLGLHVGWPGGWGDGGCGAVQEWARGVGCKATWQIKTSDRTSAIGTVSYGRRWVPLSKDGVPAHSESGYFAWLGVAIKLGGS